MFLNFELTVFVIVLEGDSLHLPNVYVELVFLVQFLQLTMNEGF